MSKCVMAVLVLVSVFVMGVQAGTYTDSTLYAAGSGCNSAVIVVDFDQDNYFMFDYSWQAGETVVAMDAVEAVAAAGALDFTTADYGWGLFISDFDYPGGLEYDYGHFSTYWSSYTSADNENWDYVQAGAVKLELQDQMMYTWVWASYDSSDIIRVPNGSPVPEPATMVLLTLGGLFLRKRK